MRLDAEQLLSCYGFVSTII